jgi:hypothetical protein
MVTWVDSSAALGDLKQLLENQGNDVSPAEVARHIGASARRVSEYLQMDENLPLPVKEMGQAGKIGFKAARALARAQTLEAHEKVAIARKMVVGAFPAGERAHEAVQLIDEVESETRRLIVGDPTITFEDAQLYIKELGAESGEPPPGAQARAVWQRLCQLAQEWAQAYGFTTADRNPAVSRHRWRGLRRQLIGLRNDIDRLLEVQEANWRLARQLNVIALSQSGQSDFQAELGNDQHS